MKLMRVNEANHSGLVPERITEIKKKYLVLKLRTAMILQSTEDNQLGLPNLKPLSNLYWN